MNRRLRVLDLFSGAGGAAFGYHRAGFEVVGVDIKKLKRFPFEFIQADVLSLSTDFLCQFDLIHASPPCQAFSDMKHAHNAKKHHPQLIRPTREMLQKTRCLWVIENVEGAPLINPVTLCGSHFGLGVEQWQLRRHRIFEANFEIEQPECQHRSPTIGIYGAHVRCRSAKYWRKGGADFPDHDKKKLAMTCMGIDWMSFAEMSEAVPPAYAEYIGLAARQLILAKAA